MNLCKATLVSCLALGIMGPGCGEKKEADGASRETKVAATEPATTRAAAAVTDTAAVPPAPKELPPPPADVYEGKARMVNLAVKDGAPVTIDIWATQSFTHSPVKLAEKVAFGAASDWFQSPKGSPVKAFVTGAGPDSKEDELGGMFHPNLGEHITGILYTDADGKLSSGNYWETSDDAAKSDTPDAPPAGKGYVIIRAGQLKSFEKAMTEVTGGWALRVGDGKGCLRQRVEDMGFQAALLGGTQPVEVDLAPGTHTIAFYKGMAKDCLEADKVYELELEVKPDAAQLVVLYTPDARVLQHGVYEMPVNSAKPYGTNQELKEARDAERAAKKAAKEAAAQ